MLPNLAQHTEKLYYFYEIAISGSIQAASRKIGVSAASLSYSMKQLESAAGSELFIRHKKGISLTSSGQILLNFCRKFYRDLEDVDRYIHNSSLEPTQRIRVGTFQSIAIYFWPLLMETLKDSSLSISITTNRSKNIIESLIKREIDIALTVEGINHKSIIKHQLYSDHYSFYVSSKIKKRTLKPDDLLTQPVLFIPDAIDENGISLRQYLDSWNLKFKDEFELDSFEVIAEFVRKGYGIGIIPSRVAKAHGSSIVKQSIQSLKENQFGSHRFFLSHRDDLDLPQKLINSILESSKKAVQQMNA